MWTRSPILRAFESPSPSAGISAASSLRRARSGPDIPSPATGGMSAQQRFLNGDFRGAGRARSQRQEAREQCATHRAHSIRLRPRGPILKAKGSRGLPWSPERVSRCRLLQRCDGGLGLRFGRLHVASLAGRFGFLDQRRRLADVARGLCARERPRGLDILTARGLSILATRRLHILAPTAGPVLGGLATRRLHILAPTAGPVLGGLATRRLHILAPTAGPVLGGL